MNNSTNQIPRIIIIIYNTYLTLISFIFKYVEDLKTNSCKSNNNRRYTLNKLNKMDCINKSIK